MKGSAPTRAAATPRRAARYSASKVGKRAYILEALQVGCGGRNLFSDIDPLSEIAAGVTFNAAP